jgi:hypothetical protein
MLGHNAPQSYIAYQLLGILKVHTPTNTGTISKRIVYYLQELLRISHGSGWRLIDVFEHLAIRSQYKNRI